MVTSLFSQKPVPIVEARQWKSLAGQLPLGRPLRLGYIAKQQFCSILLTGVELKAGFASFVGRPVGRESVPEHELFQIDFHARWTPPAYRRMPGNNIMIVWTDVVGRRRHLDTFADSHEPCFLDHQRVDGIMVPIEFLFGGVGARLPGVQVHARAEMSAC